MSKKHFVLQITVHATGQVEVERQIPGYVNQVFDLPGIGEGTRVHVLAAVQGLVLGFYAGDKSQSEFIGMYLSRNFGRDRHVPEFHIALRGVGDLQFFANLDGENVDLATCCNLSSVVDLCVDKEQGRLYIGGNIVVGSIPVIVEVDPKTALPKQVYKVGEPGRSIEWSAAFDGAVVVVLDDGTVKVLTPGHERFRNLPDGNDLRAQKVFSGSDGFFFREVSRDVSRLEVDRDGIGLGDSTYILEPGEELLCVTLGEDEKDLLVVMSNEGYIFVAAPA